MFPCKNYFFGLCTLGVYTEGKKDASANEYCFKYFENVLGSKVVPILHFI